MVFIVNPAVKKASKRAFANSPYFQSLSPAHIFTKKHSFGVPGGSLYTADSLSRDATTAGIKGEQRVARVLDALSDDYPNMYVFHSVKLPGRDGDMDHVVVQGDNVILVDSKNWKKGYTYTASPDGNVAKIYRDGREFSGGNVYLRLQLEDWRQQDMLKGCTVTAALTLANTSTVIAPAPGALGYPFININGLAGLFSQRFTKKQVATSTPLLLWLLSCVEVPPVGVVWSPQERDEASFLRDRQKNNALTRNSYLASGWKPTLYMVWTLVTLLPLQLTNIPIALLSAIPLLFFGSAELRKLRRRNQAGQTRLKISLWLVGATTVFWGTVLFVKLIQLMTA